MLYESASRSRIIPNIPLHTPIPRTPLPQPNTLPQPLAPRTTNLDHLPALITALGPGISLPLHLRPHQIAQALRRADLATDPELVNEFLIRNVQPVRA